MEQNVGFAVGGVIGILLLALIGLVIGAVAKLLMPGKDPGGWFVTILLGIAGSWIGGFLASMIGLKGNAAGFVAAVLGAMLLLVIYRMVKRS
jgi:uncharacterized membrane protein YeaQ/YmgE (transglycosylase-associated protein family)